MSPHTLVTMVAPVSTAIHPAMEHHRDISQLHTRHRAMTLPTAVDSVEARRLFRLAAEQGDSAAQCHLGIMNYEGEGGPEDPVEARRLFRLAADQGDSAAKCYLGIMNYEGEGGPTDLVEARRLLRLAAEQGNSAAQYNLGIMNHEGEGGPTDLVEARRLLRLAAEQGDSPAQFNLGIMNQAGEGGPVDSVEARRLFQLATEQGHAAAQFSLGMMNLKGEEGPVDLIEALRQIRLAHKNGHEEAHIWLDTRANLNANALLAEEEESATSQKPKSKSSKKKKERRNKEQIPAPACIDESSGAPPSQEVETTIGISSVEGSTASPVLALKDAGSITGRHNAPESTIGGDTTCIVCFTNVKSHCAAPCFHQCVCGPCSKNRLHRNHEILNYGCLHGLQTTHSLPDGSYERYGHG